MVKVSSETRHLRARGGLSAEQWFWKNVHPCPATGCWLWEGANCRGYGKFSAGPNKQVLAHRFSWELHNGPTQLDVLHRCDVPACGGVVDLGKKYGVTPTMISLIKRRKSWKWLPERQVA